MAAGLINLLSYELRVASQTLRNAEGEPCVSRAGETYTSSVTGSTGILLTF